MIHENSIFVLIRTNEFFKFVRYFFNLFVFFHWHNLFNDIKFRISLRKNQMMRLKQNLTILIEKIFTHCFEKNEKRRIFFIKNVILNMKKRKSLFDLNIVRQSKKLQIWILLNVLSQKSWMLSFKKKFENKMKKKLLYCDWNVKFS